MLLPHTLDNDVVVEEHKAAVEVREELGNEISGVVELRSLERSEGCLGERAEEERQQEGRRQQEAYWCCQALPVPADFNLPRQSRLVQDSVLREGRGGQRVSGRGLLDC